MVTLYIPDVCMYDWKRRQPTANHKFYIFIYGLVLYIDFLSIKIFVVFFEENREIQTFDYYYE